MLAFSLCMPQGALGSTWAEHPPAPPPPGGQGSFLQGASSLWEEVRQLGQHFCGLAGGGGTGQGTVERPCLGETQAGKQELAG